MLSCLKGSKICNALIPQIEKDERRQGVWRRVRHNMLPGYVFLFSDCQLDCAELSRLSGVIKILGYDTGDHALHGSDREFAVWLYRNSGCIGVSTAVAEGSRIRVTGGPLLDYAGCIKEVNRSKRIAKVAVSVDDVIRDVWMSFEWLE